MKNSTPIGENICLSGGAEGSDLQFGMVAGTIGHTVYHFSFSGHKSKAPQNEIVVLTQDQLNEADSHLVIASKDLKRYWPPKKHFVRNLLRRNWFQVRDSNACYAVSRLLQQPFAQQMPIDTIVEASVAGGTAWAVSIFIAKHNGEACNCFVFDQDLCYWFKWNGNGWRRIYEPPKPSGIWTGIGTRELNSMGKLAIRVLLDYKFNYHSETYPWKKDHEYA